MFAKPTHPWKNAFEGQGNGPQWLLSGAAFGPLP